MGNSVPYRKLNTKELNTNTRCSVCDMEGHILTSCLLVRLEMECFFQTYFYDYQHICGFFGSDFTVFLDRPFGITLHRQCIIIRTFRDLYFRVSLNKNSTDVKYVLETIVEQMTQWREEGKMHTSHAWWSDDNWRDFLALVLDIFSRLDRGETKGPAAYFLCV
jgi:hypothetical protein